MFSQESKEAMTRLGKRLKSARLEQDDTQKDFAARIGISIPTLQKMEQGNPNVAMGTWVKVLDLLDKLDELEKLLSPRESLVERYAAYEKIKGRQRAGRRKSHR